MSGDEEVNLRRLLSLEFEKSEELIQGINSCMEIVYGFIHGVKVFQIRFIKFLERCKANNFANIIDDSQIFCNKIEAYISAFYAFKSYIQAIGILLALFAPYKEIKTVGIYVAGGAFTFDFIMDFIAGLPETRRIIKSRPDKRFIKWALTRIRGVVYEEEKKQRILEAEIMASLQGVPSDVTNL